MKYEVWYSIRNGGDGSANPVFMESEKLAELDQKYENMDSEGWAEPCYGCLEIESNSLIKVKGIVTVDDEIKRISRELNQDYMKKYKADGKYPDWFTRLEGELTELKALKQNKKEE